MDIFIKDYSKWMLESKKFRKEHHSSKMVRSFLERSNRSALLFIDGIVGQGSSGCRVRVEYTLTELGYSLKPILVSLRHRGESY